MFGSFLFSILVGLLVLLPNIFKTVLLKKSYCKFHEYPYIKLRRKYKVLGVSQSVNKGVKIWPVTSTLNTGIQQT
jgi:hypothetical protein